MAREGGPVHDGLEPSVEEEEFQGDRIPASGYDLNLECASAPGYMNPQQEQLVREQQDQLQAEQHEQQHLLQQRQEQQRQEQLQEQEHHTQQQQQQMQQAPDRSRSVEPEHKIPTANWAPTYGERRRLSRRSTSVCDEPARPRATLAKRIRCASLDGEWYDSERSLDRDSSLSVSTPARHTQVRSQLWGVRLAISRSNRSMVSQFGFAAEVARASDEPRSHEHGRRGLQINGKCDRTYA